MMKPAILVVDDDTAVCELLQDVLSEHVFDVLVCHNGQDALAGYNRRRRSRLSCWI
jgi:DNA-binding response OmpR family regulator